MVHLAMNTGASPCPGSYAGVDVANSSICVGAGAEVDIKVALCSDMNQTAKRQKTVLSSENTYLLARAIIHNKTRGKDAICDAFMAQLREGERQLPPKAAVQRTIDNLAQRDDKKTPWELRDSSLANRLRLDDTLTCEEKPGPSLRMLHHYLSSPTTPDDFRNITMDVHERNGDVGNRTRAVTVEGGDEAKGIADDSQEVVLIAS
jgi:hypothetical protein